MEQLSIGAAIFILHVVEFVGRYILQVFFLNVVVFRALVMALTLYLSCDQVGQSFVAVMSFSGWWIVNSFEDAFVNQEALETGNLVVAS